MLMCAQMWGSKKRGGGGGGVCSKFSYLFCRAFVLTEHYFSWQESSCAQYIIQQYLAATGGIKLLSSIKNSYSRGKVRMLTTEFETATRITKNPIKAAENGWFVLWQMMPDKWHVELEIEGNSVQAGSDGKVVWRYTSWLGAHAAKGPVRPLRRAVQVRFECFSNLNSWHFPILCSG